MAAPIVHSEEKAEDEVDGVNCQKSISNELLYSDKFAKSECEDLNPFKILWFSVLLPLKLGHPPPDSNLVSSQLHNKKIKVIKVPQN